MTEEKTERIRNLRRAVREARNLSARWPGHPRETFYTDGIARLDASIAEYRAELASLMQEGIENG